MAVLIFVPPKSTASTGLFIYVIPLYLLKSVDIQPHISLPNYAMKNHVTLSSESFFAILHFYFCIP